MKAKLIKTGNDYLLKEYGYGETLAITSGTMEGRKLSLKNCQAIENGYDLDELAENATNKQLIRILGGEDKEEVLADIKKRKFYFIEGAKAILEILGDKKFSINEVVELTKILISNPFEKCGKTYQELTDSYIQSLQQTEWDVEIVMDDVWDGLDSTRIFPKEETSFPKLDADGCLILKLTQ